MRRALLPLSDLTSGTAYSQSDATATAVPLSSLEDFIYVGAAPNVARYQETGKCNLRLPDAPGN